MHVVEIVVKIGDSTVELVHLPLDGTYDLGSAPRVDLAVAGFGRFRLVDAGLVRVPVGVPARLAGRPVAGELRVGDAPVELALGLCRVAIRRLARACVPVPRPRVDRRAVVYFAASLVAVLALWLVAVTLAPYREPSVMHPVRWARLLHPMLPVLPKPRPKPQPQAQPKKVAASAPGPAHHAGRARHHAQENTEDGFAALRRFNESWKPPEVVLDGTGAGPDDYASNDFGNNSHFDPDSDHAFDSVKVTRFAIATAGKQLGETLPPPHMEWCDDDSCEARGPIALATYLRELERHRDAISTCYVDHTDQLEGTVRIRFEVTTAGKAYDAEFGGAVKGRGIGSVGRCVAKILAATQWPRESSESQVWLGIRFTAG
jgi:hypothetical protein